MKTLAKLIGVLLCLCLLAGCGMEIGVTEEYRTLSGLHEDLKKEWMTKEQVLQQAGLPERITRSDGSQESGQGKDEAQWREAVMSETAVQWYWTCWKYSDPRDPHYLRVFFNADGTSYGVGFGIIPGG